MFSFPHTSIFTMPSLAAVPVGDGDTPLDLFGARDLVAHRGQVRKGRERERA